MTSRGAPEAGGTSHLGLALGVILGVCGLGLSAGGVADADIAAVFAVPKASTAWVVNCFALGLGVGTIVTGRLLDLISRAGVLYGSAATVIVGAGVCEVADSFAAVLAARVLIGLGAGGLCSAAFVAGSDAVAEHARARTAGLMTGVSVAFIGLGPLLGSLAISVADWRLALSLPALAGVVGLALGSRLGRLPAPQSGTELDMTGVILVATLAAAIAGSFQTFGTRSGAWAAALLAMVAAGLGVLLRRRVRTHPNGFLPQELLRHRELMLLNATSMTLLGGYAALLFVAPVLLRERGLSTIAIGAALAPASAAAATAAHFAGAAVLRHRPTTIIAALCVGCAMALLIAGAGSELIAIVAVATALSASAFSAGQVTMQVSAADMVPANQVGASLGLFNFCFICGAAFGTSSAAGLSTAAGSSDGLVLLAVLPLVGALALKLRDRR